MAPGTTENDHVLMLLVKQIATYVFNAIEKSDTESQFYFKKQEGTLQMHLAQL